MNWETEINNLLDSAKSVLPHGSESRKQINEAMSMVRRWQNAVNADVEARSPAPAQSPDAGDLMDARKTIRSQAAELKRWHEAYGPIPPISAPSPDVGRVDPLDWVRSRVSEIDNDSGARHRAHEIMVPLSILRDLARLRAPSVSYSKIPNNSQAPTGATPSPDFQFAKADGRHSSDCLCQPCLDAHAENLRKKAEGIVMPYAASSPVAPAPEIEGLDLEALERRYAAGSPGPWVKSSSVERGITYWYVYRGYEVDGKIEKGPNQVFRVMATGEKGGDDAAIATHARDDVRALIAEICRLRTIEATPNTGEAK